MSTATRAFDAFAAANEARDLTGASVHGRSLFDFLATPEVRQLYRALLERVRGHRVVAVIPFRLPS